MTLKLLLGTFYRERTFFASINAGIIYQYAGVLNLSKTDNLIKTVVLSTHNFQFTNAGNLSKSFINFN